ncbi:MAG: Ger(x)C family spore germination protein [Peptococcaceae bacterium]|nr:Ger(x)C family spore germination protein [Peptococcaceae bacterium]
MRLLLKYLILVSLIVNSVFLTGCWDALPVENRIFCIAIGVDWLPEEPHYEITFLNPLVEETRSEQSRARTIRAHSISEAIAIFQHTSSHYMSFGILSVLVIGEEASKQKQSFTIDDLFSFPDLRPNAYIIVAKGNAKALLSVMPPENQRMGLYLRDLLDRANNQRDSPPPTLHEYVIRMMTPGMDALTTMVGPIGSLDPRATGQKTGGDGGGEVDQSEGGGSQGGQSTPEKDVEIMGAAVWQGDIVVGQLTLPETQYLSLAQGTAKGMLLQMLFAPDERLFPQANRMVTLIEQETASWDLTVMEGVPHYRLTLKVRSSPQNYEGTSDLSKSENSELLEQIMALNIAQNILASLQKITAMGSDPLCLGQQLRLKYPDLWDPQNWGENIKNSQFKVECEVTIRNIGLQILRIEPVNKKPN